METKVYTYKDISQTHSGSTPMATQNLKPATIMLTRMPTSAKHFVQDYPQLWVNNQSPLAIAMPIIIQVIQVPLRQRWIREGEG